MPAYWYIRLLYDTFLNIQNIFHSYCTGISTELLNPTVENEMKNVSQGLKQPSPPRASVLCEDFIHDP